MKRKIFSIITIISLFSPIFRFSLHPVLASDAVYQWTKTVGGSGGDQGYSVITDSQNQIYVTGVFQSTVDFDPSIDRVENHVSVGGEDIFLTKYNSDGSYGWTKTVGATGNDLGYYVMVDNQDQIYITGTFQNTVDFNPTVEGIDNHISAGSYDIFLTKYNSNGSYGWTKTIGGIGVDRGYNLVVDSQNQIYMTGYFSNTVDFNPSLEGVDSHVSAGNYDIFLSKYNSDGSYGWTKTVGGMETDVGYSLIVNSQDYVYMTGFFKNTVDFNPTEGEVDSHVSKGANDIFLTKYGSDGSYYWTQTIGGTGADMGTSIAIDSQGQIFLIGGYANTVDFNPKEEETENHSSNGSYDIYLTTYDEDGNYNWTKTWGGSGDEGAAGWKISLVLNSEDQIYISGHFQNTVDFDLSEEGIENYVSVGGNDIYVVKYNNDGSYVWTKTWGSTGGDNALNMSNNDNNEIYVTGYFSNTIDFDFTELEDNHTAVGSVDMFLMKIKDDMITPDLNINSVNPDPSNDKTPSINGTATDALGTITSVEYQMDITSGIWTVCTADNGIFDEASEAFTCSVSEALSDGSHTIYVRATDNNNNTTTSGSEISDEFTIDTISPTGEILINSGREYTGNQTVGLTISATDVILGDSTSVAIPDISLEMMICNEETYTGCSWENYDTSRSWILTEGDGTKTVYTKFRDEAENESETVTDTIILDTTSPTGTISINSDETITNTDEVTLTLSATDNLSEVSKMMVSNKGDYSGGTWETYNTSKEWRLSMGDGEKRVYVKYKDEVGNISSSNSDSIEMDMGAPTGTLIINEGEEYTSSREVVLHITGEDEVTGVEEMRISEDRTMEGVDWEGYETSREYTLSEGDGYKVIYIQYRDGIGNESEVYGSNITLDRNTEIEVTEIGEEEVEGEIVNWETEETTPTLTGEGEVGATITIEIEGIETGTVIVNADGVWSWTPSIELTRGQEYNVTITSTDLAGNEDIQSFTLGIADEEVIEVNQTTPEAQTTTTQLPNTGVIFIIGLMMMGGLIWTGMNFKVIQKLKKAHRR